LSRPITAEADTRREQAKEQIIKICKADGWITKAKITEIGGCRSYVTIADSLYMAEHHDGRLFFPSQWPEGNLPPLPEKVRKW
jgi:hypothetical protein